MNCIIIEDQPPAQRILKKYIKDVGSLKLLATFPDAIQSIAFLKANPVDLIFLDIHLPGMSGMDFLKTLSHPPHIILTTAFPDYALESYDFSVVDYLLKPFSFQRFVKAIAKIPSPNSTGSALPARKELFIKSGYEHIKITIEDIAYIKSDADYTELFVSNKKYLSSESLRYWLEELQDDQFVRVHKSYIVNIAKVVKVTAGQVYLTAGVVIPIGRAFKESFTTRFLK